MEIATRSASRAEHASTTHPARDHAGCVVSVGDRRAAMAKLVGCPSGQREQTVNLPASAYEGSNPSPTTWGARERAGVAQLVEHQPSKLRVAGSSPVARSRVRRSARVAQSVERVLGKDEVTGSIPVASSGNCELRNQPSAISYRLIR